MLLKKFPFDRESELSIEGKMARKCPDADAAGPSLDLRAPARFERASRRVIGGKPTIGFVTLPSVDFFDNAHFNYGQAEILGYLRHFHPELAREGDRSFCAIDPTAYLKAGSGNFDSGAVIDEVFGALDSFRPNVVAISAKLGTNDLLTRLVHLLNECEWAKDSVLVVGGTLPTFSHKFIAGNLPGMIFATGEGEHVLSEIYSQLKSEAPRLDAIPNISYFLDETNEVAHPKRVLSLEDIHWLPALDGLPDAVARGKIIVARSSVGCSAHCTFCAIRIQYQESKPDGKGSASVGWRHYPVTRTAALIQAYERNGVERVTFVDDEFGNEDMVFLEQLADVLIAQANRVKFDVAFRLDVISERKQKPEEMEYRVAVLRKLKLAGLYGIFVGLESGAPEQLKRYSKGIAIEEARKSLAILIELGFEVTAGFIAYDPLMRKAEIMQNMDFLESRVGDRPAYLIASRFMNMLMVQQGTPYLKLMQATGLVRRLQPNMTFYDVDYIDPRVERIGMVTKAWFYEFNGIRYAVRDVARTPLYGVHTETAKTLLESLIKIELGFVRELVALFPDDELDLEVAKLDPPAYRKIESDVMRAVRVKWRSDVESREGEIRRVTEKYRDLRAPLVQEFQDFLKAVGDFSIYNCSNPS